MALTTSLANITLDGDAWIDLCALHAETANSDVVLRYISPFFARIVHGGASPPLTPDSGDMLNPGEATYANADHIWVAGRGALSLIIL